MEAAILSRAIEIAAYSAVLFLVVLLFRLAFSRWLSPGLKYALWFLVLARLAIPVTFDSGFHFITLPQEAAPPMPAVSAPPLTPSVAADGAFIPASSGSQPALPFPEIPAAPIPTAEAERPRWSPDWRQWLLLAWAGGFVVVLAAHLLMSASLARRIRRAGFAPRRAVLQLSRRICAERGIRTVPPIVALADLSSPALTAACRPTLLLPEMLLQSASREQLTFSLLHELTHFKRRDHLVCMLITLLQAVWWFNPVVWLMPRFLRVDMESACDAQVVRDLDPAQKLRYANLLLELGQGE